MISPADSGEVEGGDAEVDELEKFMAIPVDSDEILGDKSPPAPEDIPIPLFQILQQTGINSLSSETAMLLLQLLTKSKCRRMIRLRMSIRKTLCLI